jgi:ABC-2 type transport system permease protein
VLLALACLLTALVGILVGVASALTLHTPPDQRVSSAVNCAIVGFQFTVFLIAALGAIAGAGDFASGTIGYFFAAAPRRTPVLLAKAAAAAGTATAAVGAALSAAMVVNWLLLAHAPLWDLVLHRDVTLTWIGSLLAVAAVTASGVGVGWLLRSTAGAVFTMLGLLVILPLITIAIPATAGSAVAQNVTFGGAAATLLARATDLPAWSSAAVSLTLWTAAIIGLAATTQRNREV